jgi:hypothetical protein
MSFALSAGVFLIVVPSVVLLLALVSLHCARRQQQAEPSINDLVQSWAPQLVEECKQTERLIADARKDAQRGKLVERAAYAAGVAVYEVALDGTVLISRGSQALAALGLTGDPLSGTNLYRDWSEGPDDRAIGVVRDVFEHGHPGEWLEYSSFTGQHWWGRALLETRAGVPVVRVVVHPVDQTVLGVAHGGTND